MKYIIRLRSSLPFCTLTAPDFLSLSYARSLVTSSLAFYLFDRILHLRSPVFPPIDTSRNSTFDASLA